MWTIRMTFGKLNSEANFFETHSTLWSLPTVALVEPRTSYGPSYFLTFVLIIDVFSVDLLSALPECPVTTRPCFASSAEPCFIRLASLNPPPR